MKKLVPLLVCAIWLACLITGCKSGSGTKTFRYDIPDPVENLDPLFTTDPTARILLGNLMEGLLTQSPDSAVHPGVAERYEVSADGLIYTFTLRGDAAWNDGVKVTAADFVFAFERMFSLASPFAPQYSAIQNAEAVLDGAMSASMLGVRATDDHNLTITLSHPDPFFLERLCDPAASPCNQSFFESARGRFGLELDYVSANGPFYLYSWDNEKNLQLRQNTQYHSDIPSAAERVTFWIGRDKAEQFANGGSDLAILSWSQADKLTAANARITPVGKTVWCIVFNQNHPIWGQPLLRQGLAYTLDHQAVGEGLPNGFAPATVLVPEATMLLGNPFRTFGLSQSPLSLNTQQGQRLFKLGLSAIDRDQLPSSSTIYIPELAATSLNISAVQQDWQKYLSAYINFTVVSSREIETRFSSGDYQMLLMPFTPASRDVASLLGSFTSHSKFNRFGYASPLYDDLIDSARAQPTVELAAQKYAQAEAMLLNDAVIIPLYFESTYLAVSDSVEGLEVSPFLDQIRFKYAKKGK